MTADDESLRDAARHLIAAGRSLLDAADAAIDDPELLAGLVDVLGGLARRFADLAADPSSGATVDRDGRVSDPDIATDDTSAR